MSNNVKDNGWKLEYTRTVNGTTIRLYQKMMEIHLFFKVQKVKGDKLETLYYGSSGVHAQEAFKNEQI